MNLEDARKNIDVIDAELLELLSRRCEMSAAIGKWKLEHGLPVEDDAREAALLKRLCESNRGPMNDDEIRELYRVIMGASKRLQRDMR